MPKQQRHIPLEEFADRLNDIFPVLMKEMSHLQENELYKGKITLPQFLVMQYLAKTRDVTMTMLARHMGVTTAAVTGMVERLVRDGYVERLLDPADRRVIKVALTVKGGQLLKRINEQRRAVILRVFGQISPEDRKGYLRILMQIQEIVQHNGVAT